MNMPELNFSVPRGGLSWFYKDLLSLKKDRSTSCILKNMVFVMTNVV